MRNEARFAAPAPVTALLDVPAGRIQVIAADRTDTTVEIRPADATRARDVQAADRLRVACDDGVLRITAEPPAGRLRGSSGAVEVTVQVPAGSALGVTTAAAEIRGVGRLGDVTVDGAQGSVRLDEAAAARVTLQSGGVSIGRLAGAAQISTRQGDLTVAEAHGGVLTLRTDLGDISVGAAPGVSATLDAGTAAGRISNTLVNAGPAGLTVHATTSRGDIAAHSR